MRSGLLTVVTCLAAIASEQPGLPGAGLQWQADARIPFLPAPVIQADLDGDGQPDRCLWRAEPGAKLPFGPWRLIITSAGTERPVLLSSGDPWLSPPALAATPRALPCDVDRDGRIDLILAWDRIDGLVADGGSYPGYRDAATWRPNAAEIAVAYNRGQQGEVLVFSSLRSLPMRGDEPSWRAGADPLLVDLDGDKRDDLLVAEGDHGLRVLIGVGSKQKPTFLDVGRLDGPDGDPLVGHQLARCAMIDDQLVGADRAGTVWRRLEAHGHLSRAVGAPLLRPAGVASLVAGPLAAVDVQVIDGSPRLIVGLADGSLQQMALLNGRCAAPLPLSRVDGNPVHQACERYGDGSPIGPLAWGADQPRPRVCDWDGDGIDDLLVGGTGRRILWYRGQESTDGWRLEAPLVLRLEGGPLVCPPQQPACTDMNGDGHSDLITVDLNGQLRVWLGDGGDTLHEGAVLRTGHGHAVELSGQPCGLAVVDVDGDGARDLLIADPKRGLVYHARRALGTVAAARTLIPATGITSCAIIGGDRMPSIVVTIDDGRRTHLRQLPLVR